MQHTIDRLLLLLALSALPVQALAEEAASGTLSLVTNPVVMVYVDGDRLGRSPLLNKQIPAGEHRLALLLILPNGNRLRANYRLLVEAGRDTTASLDLAHDAPREGEVRTIAPEPVAPPVVRPATPPVVAPATPPVVAPATPPAVVPPASPPQIAWATNPGRPSKAPVAVAPPPQVVAPPQQTTPPPPPQPQESFGLSRDLVREGLESLRTVVARCMEGRSGVVQVRMVIQPDGGVTDVEAQGVFNGTQAGDCIAQAIPEEAAFPIYEGDPIPVIYPYRISSE